MEDRKPTAVIRGPFVSLDETLITPSKILVYPEYVIAVYHGDSADVRYGSLEDLYADHLIANTEEA